MTVLEFDRTDLSFSQYMDICEEYEYDKVWIKEEFDNVILIVADLNNEDLFNLLLKYGGRVI